MARAAWLVGVCGGELPPPLWGEALACLVRHMGSPDLVLALSAVSALLALLSTFIEQQHVSLPHPLFTNVGEMQDAWVAGHCSITYHGSTHHFLALCAIYHTQRCSILYTSSSRQSQDVIATQCRDEVA